MSDHRGAVVPDFVVGLELAAFPDVGRLPASDGDYVRAMDRAAEELSASPCSARRGLAAKWKSMVPEQKHVWGQALVGAPVPESGATVPGTATADVDEDEVMVSWQQLMLDDELRKWVLDHARFTANQAQAVANMTGALVEKLEELEPPG